MGKVKDLIKVEITEIVITPQKISVKNILAEFRVEYTELTSKSRNNGEKCKNQLGKS
jgi:hypothetical protein